MANLTAASAKHATLTSTTVDTVTLTGSFQSFEVVNRHATEVLWVTYGEAAPADPTAGGDDCIFVPAAGVVTLDADGKVVVKILGNGNAYSVQGVS